jgi:Family of unknown function (DUF6188)
MIEFALEGQEVGRLCLDYAVVLETVDGAELRLESRFQISSLDDSQSAEVDPDRLGETGSVVVGLLRQRIALASLSESGVLSLRFTNGQRLQCEPDEQFEAWTLTTAAGERMVCLPGGGVAHWPGAPSP